jgi:transcriptional regulator with XRE-family HTH domain
MKIQGLGLMHQNEPVERQMSIGENIRRKRETSKVSQKALAEALGIAENTVASWEKGKNIPPSDRVIGIAKFLKCSTDEILLDEAEREVSEDVKALFRRYNELDEHVKPMARNILNGILGSFEMSQDWWDQADDTAGPRPKHRTDWVLPTPRDRGKP